MRTASLLDAASNESTSNTDLLEADESTWAFVAVGRVGCTVSPQVEAFVSLANATGRWNWDALRTLLSMKSGGERAGAEPFEALIHNVRAPPTPPTSGGGRVRREVTRTCVDSAGQERSDAERARAASAGPHEEE